jgi:hypothetical protein
MSAVSLIRKLVYSLPEGGTFTTRDCLAFGFRSAVDRALSRLVKNGTIRRLARGIFARDALRRMQYTDFEIATLKAQAFGRKLTKHASTIASELGLQPQKQTESIFSIDGRTTSFRIEERTIHLKEMSQRKMHLQQTKAGQAMSALWYLGYRNVGGEEIRQALSKFNSVDNLELRRSMRWMPAWLTNLFKFIRRWERPPKE